MKQQKIIYILSILLLLISCDTKNDIYKTCEISTENLTEKEYVKAMDSWLDCLVKERIKEKSKEELYDDIRGKHIEGMFLGIDGKLSDTFLSYKALSEILTNNELKENLKSNDPSIKYHSFLAIAEKDEGSILEILKSIINDTTRISTQFGCVVDETTLADLCIERVTEKYFHNYEGYKPSNYQLTLEEKKELDLLVLNSTHKLRYREYLEVNE